MPSDTATRELVIDTRNAAAGISIQELARDGKLLQDWSSHAIHQARRRYNGT
jgi:hypothetical protein